MLGFPYRLDVGVDLRKKGMGVWFGLDLFAPPLPPAANRAVLPTTTLPPWGSLGRSRWWQGAVQCGIVTRCPRGGHGSRARAEVWRHGFGAHQLEAGAQKSKCRQRRGEAPGVGQQSATWGTSDANLNTSCDSQVRCPPAAG